MNKQTRNTVLLASAAVIGIAFMIGTIIWRNNWIGSLNSQLSSLQTELAQTDPDAANEESVQEQTGISLERKNADDALMESFLEDTFTWSTRSQYEEARKEAIEHYGISADSEFMTNYMPVLEDDYDFEGKNLNLEYKDMQSYLTSAGADSYSYAACVNLSGKSPAGGESDGTILLLYTVSKDGKIVGISGYNSNI